MGQRKNECFHYSKSTRNGKISYEKALPAIDCNFCLRLEAVDLKLEREPLSSLKENGILFKYENKSKNLYSVSR